MRLTFSVGRPPAPSAALLIRIAGDVAGAAPPMEPGLFLFGATGLGYRLSDSTRLVADFRPVALVGRLTIIPGQTVLFLSHLIHYRLAWPCSFPFIVASLQSHHRTPAPLAARLLGIEFWGHRVLQEGCPVAHHPVVLPRLVADGHGRGSKKTVLSLPMAAGVLSPPPQKEGELI